MYLPLHPEMKKFLSLSLYVVHNGNNGRQGRRGIITFIDATHVKVRWEGGSYNQQYNISWFMANFWIDVNSIQKLNGFRGVSYKRKYMDFAKSKEQMHTHQSLDHTAMRNAVDNERYYQEQVRVVNDDDKVGEYAVALVNGVEPPNAHKTYRIAMESAVAATKRDGQERVIVRMCAKIIPETITTYKATVVTL